MSNQKDLENKHTALVNDLREAQLAVERAADRAVKEILRSVRAEATRRGHRIGVRSIKCNSSVRITVTGPMANHYRTPIERAMREKLPQIEAEIRTILTRKP